jgi:general secretion pathway protein G
MEVLVVVAIILILAGLGGYYFLGQANEARKSAAKIQIKTLTQAAENYALDHQGQWPQNLSVLLQRDQSGKGPYLKSQDAIIDPWGNQYQYTQPGSDAIQPSIWCEGPQGRIGN